MVRTPLDIIEDAVAVLCARVRLVEAPGPSSHTAVVADGLDSPEVAEALGRYLLGVIAGAVQMDATLSAALLPEVPTAAPSLPRRSSRPSARPTPSRR